MSLFTAMRGFICLVLFTGLYATTHGQNLHWAKQMGSIEADEGKAIAVGSSGDLYSAGNFQGSFETGGGGLPNLISRGGNDVYISKMTPSGNVVWVKQIGGAGDEQCTDIAVDGNGNIYITGIFLGTTDFDPGPGVYNMMSSSSSDAFICKLDALGNFKWVKIFGEVGSSQIFPYPVLSNSIAIDQGGNVYTTGSFDGKTDFDPGASTFYLAPVLLGGSYSTDIFVSKLDSSGNFVWAKQLGGPGFEGGHSIALDNSGNIFTTGFFNGMVDFDPGPAIFNLSAPPGQTIMYVSKLDAFGNFVWARQTAGATGLAVAADKAGNVYATGDYMNDSITISKFGPSGNPIWSKQIGAAIGWSLAVDKTCNLYVTGQFYGKADFDPGPGSFFLTSIGTGDAYVCQLDSAGMFVWVKQAGGTQHVTAYSLAVDDNYEVYITGTFEGSFDVDPGPQTLHLTSKGSMDVFVQKLDAAGAGWRPLINPGLKVFPNPTKGKFLVVFDGVYSGSTLLLRNALGQLVYLRQIDNNDRVELNVNLATGVYFLELCHRNGKKAVSRIVIE